MVAQSPNLGPDLPNGGADESDSGGTDRLVVTVTKGTQRVQPTPRLNPPCMRAGSLLRQEAQAKAVTAEIRGGFGDQLYKVCESAGCGRAPHGGRVTPCAKAPEAGVGREIR